MAEENNDVNIDDFFDEQFWESVKQGEMPPLPDKIMKAVMRTAPLKTEEFQYLLSRYPYLSITNSLEKETPVEQLELLLAQSGWLILDGGHVLIAIPGRMRYGAYQTDDSEDSRGGGAGDSDGGGIGTLQAQGINTAWELVALAQKRGWYAMLAQGTRLMLRNAWIASDALSFEMKDYVPNDDDYLAHSRVQSYGLTERMRARAENMQAPKRLRMLRGG